MKSREFVLTPGFLFSESGQPVLFYLKSSPEIGSSRTTAAAAPATITHFETAGGNDLGDVLALTCRAFDLLLFRDSYKHRKFFSTLLTQEFIDGHFRHTFLLFLQIFNVFEKRL